MNNLVFGKTMQNVKKHKDIKFVRTCQRRICLVLDLHCNTTKWCSENLLGIEMNKTKYK